MATDAENFSRFQAYIDGLKVHRDQVEGASLKKPLALLLVISRIHRGIMKENRIRFPEIERELAELIREFCWRTLSASPCPEQPFERLASSPIWQLHVASGASRGARKSLPREVLRAPTTFASLEDATFRWLQSSADARRQAAQHILKRWCPPEKHQAICEKLALV